MQGSTGAISFANSNGITFGGNASTITASHNGLTTARASNDAIGLNTAGTNVTWTANSSGLSINASGYAGTGSGFTGGASISGSITHNSVGLSMSLSHPAWITTAAQSNHSHGNPTLALTNISGTTASASNGLTLSLSAAAPGAVTLTNYATGNTTQSSSGTIAGSSIILRGSGGISAGVSNGSLIVEGPALTSLSVTGALSASSNGSTISLGVGTVTVSATSNTTQGSSGTINLNAMVLAGQGVASVGVSNGSLVISVPSGGGAGDGVNILAAGTQTAATTGTVLFNNSNGITFGMSNSSVITASHNGLTTARASNDAVGLNTAATNVTWTVNSSGISLNGSGYAGTATAITGGALITLNSGGLSFNGSGLAGTASGFTGGASISGSMTHNSAGLSLSLSHPAWISTQSAQAFSAGAASSTFQTLSFQDSNGVSFSNNAGAIRVTHGLAGTGTTTNGANISLSMTLNSAGLNLSASVGAGGGGVTPVASASNGSFSFTTLAFSNANNVTFGTSAGSIITASVAAPGAAAEANAINLLGANTAGNTTATGSTIGWSGVNLTMSGTNGSQVVVSAPATSSLSATGIVSISTNGSTISIGVPAGTATMWQPFNEGVNVAGQQGQAIMHFVPLPTPTPAALGQLHIDRLCIPLILSNSSNSSGTVTLSYSIGLFTKNASTLSLVMSTSYTTAATFSGTVNNSTFAGVRLHTVPWTTTIEDGRYYVGQWSRTTTGGGNATFNQWLVSQPNSNYSGLFGGNSNRSHQYPLGMGAYSVSFSTAMPNSFAISQIDGTASIVARPPSFFMINGTV